MSSETETYSVLKSDREKGLKLMFEQYAKKLLAYSTHNWQVDEDAAWDLIYKTMYKVADVIQEYEFVSEQKFASFIFKIYINYLRNHLRDSKTASQGIVEVELNENIVHNYSPATKPQASNPALSLLQQELDKLEDWQRILLLMRGQDIAYSEIAKYVNKTEDQLKVYYGRLKKQLAERINAQLITTSI